MGQVTGSNAADIHRHSFTTAAPKTEHTQLPHLLTKGVVFAPAGMKRPRALRGCNWHYRGQPICVDTHYTYLGLRFDEKEGCQGAVAVRAKAGRFAMQSLMGRVRVLRLDQSDIVCRLFDQLVEPVLSFGCQIWGPPSLLLLLLSLHGRYTVLHPSYPP